MVETLISIEVVYATPEKQKIMSLSVVEGTTVAEAIEQSGIARFFPEIDLNKNAVGIWNKTCKTTDTPRQGDRIEIYRPLIADPKEIRRRRAEQAKEDGRADKVTGGRPDQQRGKGLSAKAAEQTVGNRSTDSHSTESQTSENSNNINKADRDA
jgi:putative ubiquitin-RnfH superfamily antitoxin RatB of RatAB toxin-antitoxin module